MKDEIEIVCWVDTPVRVKHKTKHIKKIKENYKKSFFYTGFINDYGDIPMGRFNNITNQFEPCINNRGYGYAKRKDIKYRRKKVGC
jgi:hypothetical protein